MLFINTAINVLFLLGAIQLVRVARARKLPNLYWLAANFAFAALGGLVNLIFTSLLASLLGLIVSGLCMVMFIQRTFYRDLPSPYLFILALLAGLGVWQVYLTITNPTSFVVMTQVGYAILWLWQAFLAFRTYRQLAHDPTVEDWVKARSLMWFGQTFAMGILSVRLLLSQFVPISVIEWNINTSLVIIGGVVQYLTWVMPEPLRRWLNRNYHPAIAESPGTFMAMSEEDVMRHIEN